MAMAILGARGAGIRLSDRISTLYQAAGVEGIAPLDAALGLPDEKYTTELRRVVAEERAAPISHEWLPVIPRAG